MKKQKRLKNHAIIVKVAGWSYIALALLYPVFTLSSTQPVTAPKGVNSVLTQLVAGGASDHVLLTLFACIPLLLVSGGVGFYSATKPYAFKCAGVSLIFSILAALGFLLGIGRWSTFNWGLGEAFAQYQMDSEVVDAVYHIANHVMGYWLGQVVAELSLFVAIGAMSVAMFYSKRFPLWLSGFAGVVFVFGFAATFRDTNMVASYAHWLLTTFMFVPIYFLLLGIALIRFVGKAKEKPLRRHSKKKKETKAKNNKPKNIKRKTKKGTNN